MAANFSRVFPSGLIERLRGEVPEFAQLQHRHQVCIAQMTWDYANPIYRHIRYETSAAFSVEYMRELWKNLRTRNRIVKEFFSVLQGNNIEASLSAYVPFRPLGMALVGFLEDPSPADLLDDGKRLVVPSRPIRSRASNKDPAVTFAKNSVWTDVTPAGWLPVNQTALLRFTQTAANESHRLSALRILRLSRNTTRPGEIPLVYQQATTGRLFERFFNIQNTQREVISAALDGYWDYDLANAHFGIFSERAKQLGLATPVTDGYIANKKKLRADLADECGVEIDQIKQALLAVLYGAILQGKASPTTEQASIPRLLGNAGASAFVSNPFVKQLKAEIIRVGARIVSAARSGNRGFTNAMGIRAPANSTPAALLCHCLQGWEAQILRAWVRRYGEDILLLMHDGFVARRRLDRAELEALITETTGFHLSVEEVQLPKYPPVQGSPKPWQFAEKKRGPLTRFVLSLCPKWSLPDGSAAGVYHRKDLLWPRKVK